MAQKSSEALIAHESPLLTPEMRIYAVGMVGLAERKTELRSAIVKTIVRDTLKGDANLDKALEFVATFKPTPAELFRTGVSDEMREQSRLVGEFASEVVAYAAETIREEPGSSLQMLGNAMSIGRMNGNMRDPNYAEVLVDGVKKGVSGSFQEVELVRELAALRVQEKKVMPALQGKKDLFPNAFDNPEGMCVGQEFLRYNITEDTLHYLDKDEPSEKARAEVMIHLGSASPELFTHLTIYTLNALAVARNFEGQISLEDSTLGALSHKLFMAWREVPQRFKEGVHILQDMLEYIGNIKPEYQFSNKDAKNRMDELQKVIHEMLAPEA